MAVTELFNYIRIYSVDDINTVHSQGFLISDFSYFSCQRVSNTPFLPRLPAPSRSNAQGHKSVIKAEWCLSIKCGDVVVDATGRELKGKRIANRRDKICKKLMRATSNVNFTYIKMNVTTIKLVQPCIKVFSFIMIMSKMTSFCMFSRKICRELVAKLAYLLLCAH